MRNVIASLVLTAAVMVPSVSHAVSADELKTILTRYGVKTNGLDRAQLEQMRKDLSGTPAGQKRAAKKSAKPKPAMSNEEIFLAGRAVARSQAGLPADPPPPPKHDIDVCTDPAQSYFVRRDRIDSFLYTPGKTPDAQGASVVFTGNELTHTKSATINGFFAVLPDKWRSPCLRRPPGDRYQGFVSGYAIAPWVSAQGTISDAVKPSEKSALSGGVDAQWMYFSGPLFNLQAFKLSPYYQTDFRGIGSAQGVSATWEPWQYAIRLGGSPGLPPAPVSQFLDYYWRIELEADARRVDKIGFTDLAIGHYAWLGGTAQLYAFFFPDMTMFPSLSNRLKAVLTYQAFWDAYSSRSLSRYKAELAYNILADGSASISVGYERGTAKETMTFLDQYVVRLNYKY